MASIRKRGKNSYQIIVSCGYDSTGKKLTEQKSVKRPAGMTDKQWERELEKLALEFEHQVETGQYLDGGKITFAEFINRWIEDYARTELAPKTLSRYQDLLKRIIPALGHIPLQKLQPNHLLEFYANLRENGIRTDATYTVKPELNELLQEKGITDKSLAKNAGIDIRTIRKALKGKTIRHTTAQAISKVLDIKVDKVFDMNGEPVPLSDQTIRHHHRLISSILTCAVQWQCILSNPAARVKPPKVKKREMAHFDEDTAEIMLDLLDNEPLKYKVAIFLTLYAGCRLGELCGLEWSDVNFENNLLRIRQASQYIPGQGTFTKPPKNEASIRIIAMPDVVISLLKEYRTWWLEQQLKCGDLWDKHSDRLLIQWNGKPMHPTTPSKWFKTFIEKNNLPKLTFHGLRHTNASILIGEGVDIQTLATRLGHTKPTTTTNIYSHFLKKPDREAAEKLQKLFNKKGNQKQKTPKQA
jgi:integrase